MTYLANPNLYDLGYLSILPTEGTPANWYPNRYVLPSFAGFLNDLFRFSSYNPSYGQDYAIYSSNPFDYDQSTQFLDFEDASSIGTESSTMSTASVETLKSPLDSESLIDRLNIPEENRVTQTDFPFPIPSSQVAPGRTVSTSGDHMISSQHFSSIINVRSMTPFQPVTGDQMPRALHPSFPIDLFEDSQSTISELEVDERDRIAKINAEYNAISHAGSLDNSPSPPKYPPDRFRDSIHMPQLSSMHTRPYPALSASQPRHPDLHFPPGQIGNEKKELSSSPYRIYASPVVSIPHDLSPPIVERLPSQLPSEQHLIANRSPQSQSSPPAGNRNHGGTSDLVRSRIVQNGISPLTGFIHSDPQTYISKVEKSQTLGPSSIFPAEIPRKPTPPVVTANGHSPQSVASDVQESLQYEQQPRSGAPSLVQPSTTSKNHTSPHNASPDSRQYTGVLKLSQINDATELESTERIPLGSNLRRDTKTPGPPGRGPSHIQPLEPPSLSSQNDHNSPDMRAKDSRKSSPKSVLDEKSSYVNNCRPPGEVSLSSSDSSSSSVSPSNRTLPHEDIISLRRTTKDADHDRGFERHRRLRTTGTERTAASKLTDETSHGTAPMHTQGPLHLSPEGTLGTFLQPDSQVVSVTASEHRPTDLRQSKTLYDQASIPKSLDSRESRNVHERQNVNFANPQSETTKHERMLSAALQSFPVNNFATTSSSLPSKATLGSSPTPVPPEPHRRHSDGDQVGPPIRPPLHSRNSAPLVRSVRWTDNLIAPSPILAPPRRKGWFNRRGQVVVTRLR